MLLSDNGHLEICIKIHTAISDVQRANKVRLIIYFVAFCVANIDEIVLGDGKKAKVPARNPSKKKSSSLCN